MEERFHGPKMLPGHLLLHAGEPTIWQRYRWLRGYRNELVLAPPLRWTYHVEREGPRERWKLKLEVREQGELSEPKKPS